MKPQARRNSEIHQQETLVESILAGVTLFALIPAICILSLLLGA